MQNNPDYNYQHNNWNHYLTDYNSHQGKGFHDEEKYDRGNQKINFHTFAVLNDRQKGRSLGENKNIGDGSPQSVAIDPYGNTYVTYIRSRKNQIVKYNLKRVHHKVINSVKVGPIFQAGHGQGLAWNPKTHTLWMPMNQDSANYTGLEEFSPQTLRPIRIIKFHSFGLGMPDALAFDKNGNAYSAVETYGGSAPLYSIKLFKGKVTRNSVHFHLLNYGILHSPGLILQNINYNPSTNRLYIVSNSGILSAPVSDITNLSANDIKGTRFYGHREFEGLGFYRGHDLLLVNSSSKLMISNHKF